MSTSNPKVGSPEFDKLSADEKYNVATTAYFNGEIDQETWYHYIDGLSDEVRQVRQSEGAD